jgi:hypothetical protein
MTLWRSKANITATLAVVDHTQSQLFQAALDTELTVILPRLFPLLSTCIILPIGTVKNSSVN